MYAPFAVMFTKAKSCLKTTNAPCAASAPISLKKLSKSRIPRQNAA